MFGKRKANQNGADAYEPYDEGLPYGEADYGPEYDMPEYDPDAEVIGLTLTIPSWSSSIDRIGRSDLDNVSASARARLFNALTDLQNTIVSMISAIKEEP